jgi:MFS family permease
MLATVSATLATTFAQYRALSRNAKLYLISGTIQAISVGAAVILYTLFLNALHYSNTFISEVLFVGALGGALGILPAGMLVDRLGWRAMLLWSDVLGGGALLFQFLVPTRGVTLATSVVAGLSVAMVIVINAPLLTANSSPAERTALFGLSNATGFLASVVGSLLGGILPVWLAQRAIQHGRLVLAMQPLLVSDPTARGYQLALLITGAISIPSLIPVLMMREDRPVARAGRRADATTQGLSTLVVLHEWQGRAWQAGQAGRTRVAHLWSTRRERWPELVARGRVEARGPIVRYTVAQALVALGAGLFAPYVNIYFVRDLHATTAFYGALASALTISLAVASLFAAPLSDRFGKVRLTLVAETCSLPFLVALGAAPALGVAAAFFLVRGFLMNMASPAIGAFYMEAVPSEQRGVASSVNNGVWQGVWALGAVIGGPISDAGGNRVLFLLATPLYAVSILLLAIWFLRPAQIGKPTTESTEHTETAQRFQR